MPDYTYFNGARFAIGNIFRSLRFDVDRLDLNWVEGEKPTFTRGLRIVDHEDGNTVTVDGEDGDNLIYSIGYIFTKEDLENFKNRVDEYLLTALSSREYLVSKQRKDAETGIKTEEAVLH